MRVDRMTHKLQGALQAASESASQRGHAELDNEHVVLALLEQGEGVAGPVFEAAGVRVSAVREELGEVLKKRATVQGGGQAALARDLALTFEAAEKERVRLGDDFLSVEHFLLGLMRGRTTASRLVEKHGGRLESLERAIRDIRGTRRVTDQDPEGKRGTLEKYGRDLTALSLIHI